MQLALGLCGRVDHGPQQLYRLAGVGLSNFAFEAEQSECNEKKSSALKEHLFEPGQQFPLLITDEAGGVVE